MALPDVPAYLIKGDDPTLIADEVRRVVTQLAGDDALAVEDLSGDDAGVGAVVDACNTPSLLGDRRVIVLRDVGRFRTEDVAPLVEYLGAPVDSAVLVLAAGGGQVPTKLLNAVKKVGHVIDAAVPGGKGRTSWLVARLKAAPVKLDAAAGNLLGEHLGEDMGRLSTLLDALASAYGEGASVGVSEIEPFLGQAGGVAPWDLTDAIDRGEIESALVQLHRMMEAGERHPLVVLATLHRHYGAMLRLDGSGVAGEKEAAELLGTSPYPAKKAMAQARRLGSAGIAQAIDLIAQADVDLRGARAWPDQLILEVLVARLSRLSRRKPASATR